MAPTRQLLKCATPAFPGQRGFVGGSMGDDAVIIKSVESEEAKASLYSTVHGAGRCLVSRADMMSEGSCGSRSTTMRSAPSRVKELKKWRRDWKIRLIEEHNPNWEDLYPGITS
jgi:RNA-splicing ligase RtcB